MTRSNRRMSRALLSAASVIAAACGAAVIAPPAAIATATASPVATWTQLTPPAAPSPRQGAMSAYDPATGQVVLFGGQLPSGAVLGDTWTWNGSNWTEVSSSGGPAARWFGAMAYDPATGQLLLFGGGTGTVAFNDTWNWNGSSWNEVNAGGTGAGFPTVRVEMSMAYDAATGQMLMFGGANNSTTFGDTWVWSGSAWTNTNTSGPNVRQSPQFAYDPASAQMILFGGFKPTGVLNDTWLWTGTGWTQLSPQTVPPPDHLAVFAYDPATAQMILFGGNGKNGLSNATWSWTGTNWTQLSPSASPAARESPDFAYDAAANQLVVFGGDSSTGGMNDTWTWGYPAGASSIWNQLSPTTVPPARAGGAMAFDGTTGQMVMFGGIASGNTDLNDTWGWSAATANWTQLVDAPCTSSCTSSPPARTDSSMAYDPSSGQLILFGGNSSLGQLNDTWAWTSSGWAQVDDSGDPGCSTGCVASPPARSDTTLAYDPALRELVLFGGSTSGGSANDTWVWNGTGWSEVTVSGSSPAARYGASMSYDPATSQMLLFGGQGTSSLLGDTWAWNGGNSSWTEVDAGGGSDVSARDWASMGYDPATGQLVLVDGFNNAGDDIDTWAWSGSQWTQLAVQSNPPGHLAAMAYDPATTQMLLFGGYSGNAQSFTWAYTPVITSPSAPTNVSATAGDGSATISFAPPQSLGGSPITSYTVTAVGNSSLTASGATSPIVVSGLTDGDSYTFTVTATNAVGTGPPSSASNQVTPLSVLPGEPTDVSASAGNASATVTFTPPTYQGASAITSYTVTPVDSTDSSHSGPAVSVSGSPANVTGLTNGDSYTFTVAAVNGNGTGTGASSNAVVPATVPGAPDDALASAGDASAVVSFAAPSNDGGNAITKFTVTATDLTTPANGGEVASGPASPLTVDGLQNGDRYSFTVTATNSIGTGPPSAASNVVDPVTHPGSPTITSVHAGSGSITASWTAPTSGGSPISYYILEAAPHSGSVVTAWAGPAATSGSITGLVNGTAYSVTVTAYNGAGAGLPSAARVATPIGVPSAPTSVDAAPGAGRATVTWRAPAQNGGSPITSYTVTPFSGMSELTSLAVTVKASATSAVVTRLTNGQSYFFFVVAHNAAGTSPPSLASPIVTPEGTPPPLPPQGYYLLGQNGRVLAAGAAPSEPRFSTSGSDPAVGIATPPDGRGYFAVTRDGVVHTAGDAIFRGDLLHPRGGAVVHVSDIVDIEATSDGGGYWLLGGNGRVYPFGDAHFHGDMLHLPNGGALHVSNIVGMVASPTGSGYLLIGSDGGVFAFGAVHFYGSIPGFNNIKVDDIRGIVPTPGYKGYVLVGADGGAFCFGTRAPFNGSLPGEHIHVDDVVGIALTPGGDGYWMAGSKGTVYPFGDAKRFPQNSGLGAALPIAAIASS